MLKAILLDAYGTLFNTGTGSVDAAAQILSRNGRPDIPPAAFYARWKALHHQLMAQLPDFHTEARLYAMGLSILYREYGLPGDPARDVEAMLAIQGTRVAYPDVRPALEALAPRYTLCVASTSDTAPLREDLARAGLPVARVFSSEDLACYKPNPGFYRAILQAVGAAPEEAIFVGDSLSDDVKGPQRVGIKACWVNRKGAKVGDARPDWTITSLGELPALLTTLDGDSLAATPS